jgi:hypothetical protein
MIKSLVLASCLVVSGFSLVAQNVAPAAPVKKEQNKAEEKKRSPEEKAIRNLRMMTARCVLTDAQTPAVKQILLDRENSIEKIRSNSPKGTDKKGAIESIKKEADLKLSNAMSTEQWAKWLSFKEEQKKRKEAGQGNPKKSGNKTEKEDEY